MQQIWVIDRYVLLSGASSTGFTVPNTYNTHPFSKECDTHDNVGLGEGRSLTGAEKTMK